MRPVASPFSKFGWAARATNV